MKRSSWSPFVLAGLLACTACTPSESDDDDDDVGEADSTSEDDTTDATDDADTTDDMGDTGDTTDATDDADTDETTEGSDSTDTGDPDCTGPQTTQPLPAQFEQPASPTEPGSTWAYFELTDFQPQSCNFGQTYGLETFKGRVTLVTLMRSNCEICQGTLEHLEEMQIQLELEGYEVWFVVINQPGFEATQQEFIDRASFPLLQDTAEVKAWDLMNQLEPLMGTDDIYIYTADGVLSSYFSYAANNPTIMLETQAGYDNVYNAILAAME
jgi:hypothetical protein